MLIKFVDNMTFKVIIKVINTVIKLDYVEDRTHQKPSHNIRPP